jgi:hypothetical protein
LTVSVQVPDEHFLQYPQCVLCAGSNDGSLVTNMVVNNRTVTNKRQLRINLKLAAGWLYWDDLTGHYSNMPSDEAQREQFRYLGRYGSYRLYVNAADWGYFREFVLFILGTSVTSSSNGAGGNAGGGKSGGSREATDFLLSAGGTTAPLVPPPRR